MKTLRSVFFVVLLCALLTVSVLAAEGFNAKLDVTVTDTAITVEVQDSQVLQDQKPTLTIPCEFPYAEVTFDGKTVASVLQNGAISFSVAKGGQYIITKTSAPQPEKPEGGEGEVGGTTPPAQTQPTEPVGSSTVTKPDGTVVQRETGKDGTVVETTTKPSGAVTAKVTVPKQVSKTTIKIPVENPSAGTVAVIIHADGTEEVVKLSVAAKDGLLVQLDESAFLRLEDRSSSFADVKDTDWEKAAVDFVSARQLFSGTGNGKFSPDAPTTRGMIVTVLARLDGQSTAAAAGQAWYGPGLRWAKAIGLSDGTNPQNPVTREQLAVMLWRYAGSPGSGGSLSRFSDGGQASEWAVDALRWAVANGIMKGNPNGTLNPKGQATRAQVSQMLMNYVKYMV